MKPAGFVNVQRVSALVLVPLLLLALAAGAVAAYAPKGGIAVALLALGAIAFLLAERVSSLFLRGLFILLLGYAFFDKSFAYVGRAPIFVGEVGLALALLTLALLGWRLRLDLTHALLIGFVVLGAIDTIPYIARYQVDALRDGVLWAYAAFALALSVVMRGDRFETVVSRYRSIVPVFIVWAPVAALVYMLLGSRLPNVPGSDVPLLLFKAPDAGVHLAGAAAFILAGLYARGRTGHGMRETLLWPVWLTAVGIVGAVSRGGLAAVAVALVAVLVLYPSRRWLRMLLVAALCAAAVVLVNPSIDFGGPRAVSPRQFAANLWSAVSSTGDPGLQGTKEWRLRWWGEIVDYTVHGPYFWSGKGFGINLADSDGFQVNADGSLRSPHNSHMTVLARMGVPGFSLWVALQCSFGLAMLRALVRSRKRGDRFWGPVLAWLLVYWLAMLVNTSFDVYLEGPQGGIWFWSVVGLGLAAMRLSREAVDVAEPEPAAGAALATRANAT